MAYTVQKRAEFKDMTGIDWKIEIEEDAAAPATVTALTCTDNPLVFEFNSTDDVFNPLHDSKASFTVYSDTQFALADLYATEDLQFRVKIYQATVLYWMGFIVTNDYTEPYVMPPYPVTIKASCGLSVLKNVLYDNAGTYYSGRRHESQIIIDILGKIGYTGFKEYINIYEESMSQTSAHSPLLQVKIDVDIFKDMYCDEVLKEVLKKYNACITHKDGGFVLYRPTELVGATVYGRSYSSYGSHSNTSYTPAKYINRTAHSSTLEQVSGGVLMIQNPAKTVNINQDYGYKDSWLDNWEFRSNKFSGTIITGVEAENWTRSGGQTIAPIADAIITETDGVLLTNHNGSVPPTRYIYQQFGINAVSSSDVLSIEFDYLIHNTSGGATTDRSITIKIKSDSSSHWLYNVDEIDCAWSGTLDYINFSATSAEGSSGWITYKKTIPGLPTTGTYTISIYGLDDDETDVYLGIKNVKFYATSDEMTVKRYKESYFPLIWSKWKKTRKYKDIKEVTQDTYTKTNAINGVDLDYDYRLGDVIDVNIDNVIEQFQGALATYVSTVLDYSTDWNSYDGTHTSKAESKPLLEIIGDEIAEQYERPKQLIQMPIHDLGSAVSAINIIGSFQDDLNQYSGSNREFVFNRGDFDVLNRRWTIDLMEII